MDTVLFTASTRSHIMNFHRPYLAAFHKLGWRVHVACGSDQAPIPEADKTIWLPFEKKMTAPENFRAQQILREAIKAENYALICTHTSLAAFFTRRAAAGIRHRPPIVNMAHGFLFDDQTPLLKKAVLLTAEYITAPQTDLLLTMNRYDTEVAQRHHLGRRVAYVPGIGLPSPEEDCNADGAALRHDLGMKPGDFLLVYAAEFSARKNQAMLLRAMQALPPQVKLLLPGQGALLKDCMALAGSLGVADRVVFPGQVSDMPRWYAAADAAVTSSRSEGLPFNVMEAMARGLPVIASAVKGHTDLITNGKTGLLYPYNDAAAFANAVRYLLETPAAMSAMADAAGKAVGAYHLDAVLPIVMDAYLSVVPEAQARAPRESRFANTR